LSVFNSATDELQWNKKSEAEKSDDEARLNYEKESLYNIDDLSHDSSERTGAPNVLNEAYIPIASRALVEISRQLKRIADHLDDK